MRGLGAIAAAALAMASPIGNVARAHRRSYQPNPDSRRSVRTNRPTLYNTEADGARAMRRAKRWLARYGGNTMPPAHIYRNAEKAAHQFGSDIAD